MQGAAASGIGRRVLAALPGRLRSPFTWVVVAFAIVYALAGTLIALSLWGSGDFLLPGLSILVVLCVTVFAGSLLEARRTAQRFYLALSLVPGLTVARLAFLGLSITILDPLLVYLLLAVALLAFRQSSGRGLGSRSLSRNQWLRAVLLGAVLAAGFTILAAVLPLSNGSALHEPLWISILILAPVALVDELWFRGILQDGLTGVTSPRIGWLATAALFVAYGAPFGDAGVLLFRLAYAGAFGALAMRRENLPVAFVARTAMAVAIMALVPGLAGSALIV